MQRLVLAVTGATALVLMGCGEVDLEQAGRNAEYQPDQQRERDRWDGDREGYPATVEHA